MFFKSALRIFVSLAALWSGTACAQSAASPFTTGSRYDDFRRIVGTIAPDPDDTTGPIHFKAVRYSYNVDNLPVKIEIGELAAWQSESVAPSSWAGFTIFQTINRIYDPMGRKLTETISSPGAPYALTAYALTQYSYDSLGRLECTAVRMNPVVYASLPPSACTLGTEGNQGPDRISHNVYDAAGQLLKVQKAYGTGALQQDYASYAYTPNGKPAYVIDANGNKTAYGYDGFDRLTYQAFPSTSTPGAASTTDFEQYNYDNNGNRTWFRKRDGRGITSFYDALNRVTSKILAGGGACVSGYACTTPPSWAVRNVYFSYDLQGHQLAARFDSPIGTDAVVNTYDGFGRQTSSTTSMGGVSRTLSYQYDANGNRTRITHPDGTAFAYEYDGLDRLSYLRDGAGNQLALSLYYANGRRAWLGQGANGTGYSWDPVMRLNSYGMQRYDPPTNMVMQVNTGFGYNAASQIAWQNRDSDAYAFTGYATASTPYTVNGLNQYTTVGGGALGYDSNGNLASTGSSSGCTSGTCFTYDVENRLVSATGSRNTMMVYDPLGRLFQTSGGISGTTQFLYDGDDLIAEYDGYGTRLRRYVHVDGDDHPLLWYEGASTTPRRLYADHQGSIIQVIDDSGALRAINSYDEYGVPAATNYDAATLPQRFQYTGQAYLPDLDMYYYKARVYSSRLGRFLQTDPIGYKDQMDLYAYVGNDPIDGRDPSGNETIVITWYDTFLGIRYGEHSAIYITGDKGSRTDGFLYDPSGSYQKRDDYGQLNRDESGTFDHANLSDYLKPGLKDGFSVRLTTLGTNQKEEAALKDRAFENGDHRGFNCATDCSTVLHDVPGLSNLNATLPGTLANQAAASARATGDVMVAPNGATTQIPKPQALPPAPSPCDRAGPHAVC